MCQNMRGFYGDPALGIGNVLEGGAGECWQCVALHRVLIVCVYTMNSWYGYPGTCTEKQMCKHSQFKQSQVHTQ